ncbi:MAG: hypothetical protein U5K72_15415 [Balneolaceae bacterium]|nr:hypothetical protein [Balneolaceae bacterium]
MRSTFITIVSFFLLLFGCSSEKNLMTDYDIEIIQASYKHWSEAPPVQSDVRERGTDLELIVENWPEGAEPRHIIYRKMRSFPVEIVDSTETGMTVQARIIRTSAVMSETSGRVEQSDRLVFTLADGKMGYVEIDEWSRMEE